MKDIADYNYWVGTKKPAEKDSKEIHEYYSFTKWVGRMNLDGEEPITDFDGKTFTVKLDKTNKNKHFFHTNPPSTWGEKYKIVFKWKK